VLSYLRNSVNSWTVRILAGILMLSFAVWGIGDIFRRSDRTVVVAEVGQIEINGREFSQQFTRQTKEISKYIGADLDAKKARKLGFIDETIGGLTARALFTNAAMDLGLTVNDKLVREWIKNDKNFHDEFGEFSEFLFRELTYESGYSEESYVEGTRQDIARDQLLNSISVNFSPPESILDSLAAFRSEQREAQTFTLKFETITDLKNPKKETLMEYYSKNKEKFKKPEYRKISMIDVNARDLVGAIKISEDKITELYQDKEETFISPERRFVEQIIFTKESDAKKGLERISKGDDFYQVAKDVANQDKKETSLGWNERDNMPDDIASVVFNLEKETTSKIHKTDFGWHIFKVTKIEAEKRKSLDEVRESLRVELASEKAVEELYELIEKVQDEIGGGATLEEAASSLNLKLKKIESIDSKGKDNDGKEIGAIPKYRFLDEIFKEDKSSLTDLIETDDDGFFIARVDDITAETIPDYEKTQEKVKEEWKKKEQEEKAKVLTQKTIKKIKNGKSFGSVAKSMKLEVKVSKPFSRLDHSEAEIPTPLISKLFELDTGDVTMYKGDEGYIVAQVTKVGSTGSFSDEDLEQVNLQIQKSISKDLITGYAAILRKRYKIEIYDQLIDDLI
jgi:peptidyl-prolyl cis-trans isomerase D|tara:strand:- start:1331 stop:3205 length:1875 start_codon:yes stop_codon:yes gene_type:complete